MEDNQNTRTRLTHRQIEVTRRNLVSVCRFSVKSLIDNASYSYIDTECEEFVNFCAVLEQVLLHRIRPHKTWYGSPDNTYFWDYIRAACRHVPQSCISSIDAIENIKSPIAKGRAFIRCALMEKKLSEYISAALKQPHVTRKHYMDGAVLLSEDGNMLCGILLGLNAIDFSFCLKGSNMDLLGPLAIDFTPFLQFQQSVESAVQDLEEMRELSSSSISSSIMSEEMIDDSLWKNKYKQLEYKYKSASEQKGYLEELVRLRERQVEDISKDFQNLHMRIQFVEAEAQRDRLQLENVVLELQEQLSKVKSERQTLQQRLSLILSMREPPTSKKIKEIQMAEMAGESLHSLDPSGELQAFPESTEMAMYHTGGHLVQQDNKSLLSGSSGQFTAREDSHSMIPLTGSLTDVQIRTSDSQVPESSDSRSIQSLTPVHQVKQTAATESKPEQTSRETDDSELPERSAETEAVLRERTPAQAYPSFSYVDLDASLDETAPDASGDPLGIEKVLEQTTDTHAKSENQSPPHQMVDSQDSDMTTSNGNTSSEKIESGTSDYDIVNPENEKSSSEESIVDLSKPTDSSQSVEEEFHNVEDSKTAEQVSNVSEENTPQADVHQTDMGKSELTVDDSRDSSEPCQVSPGGYSGGSSEGDKDWEFMSDSNGKGQSEDQQDGNDEKQ